MRIFIAIPLPDNIQKQVSFLQDRLRKSKADIKWVNPDNIHITLKFLGDIDNKIIEIMTQNLRKKIKSYFSFDVFISNMGAFPSPLCPQIIWAGIHEARCACVLLQKEVELCAEKSGIKKEIRAFFPHLTLGRVRSQKNKQELIRILEEEKDFSITTKIPVKKIVLFSSLLTRQGPIYSSLEEFPLLETY